MADCIPAIYVPLMPLILSAIYICKAVVLNRQHPLIAFYFRDRIRKDYSMAKVYIVTRPTENKFGWTPDLSDAARYGTLCVLYEPDERPQFHPNKAIKIAREIMQDFSPEDFLLWPGGSDPIGVMIACMVASEFSSEVNVLRWERNFNNGERDRSKGFYMPVKLDLS